MRCPHCLEEERKDHACDPARLKVLLADERYRARECTRVVREWAEKMGHERCHYYPDLFRYMCTVLGVEQPAVGGPPPRAEFEEGCRKFQEELYGKEVACGATPGN